MSLFERVRAEGVPLKKQAKDTGVPEKILRKVYDRGADAAADISPTADPDAVGQARVADFVRGGASREKDGDLWDKYQAEGLIEHVNSKGQTTAGVFIPLPDTLARYFPKKAEDDSVPHITMLMIGPVTPESEKQIVEAIKKVAQQWPPFRMDLAAYGEFQNKEGLTIAHMIPAAAICLSQRDEIYRGLGDLHADLYAAIEDAGLPVVHFYGGKKATNHSERVAAFKAHATLAYVPPGEKYEGHRPTGSWQVTEIEVWGYEKYRLPLGLSPQQIPLPAAVAPMIRPEEPPRPAAIVVREQTETHSVVDITTEPKVLDAKHVVEEAVDLDKIHPLDFSKMAKHESVPDPGPPGPVSACATDPNKLAGPAAVEEAPAKPEPTPAPAPPGPAPAPIVLTKRALYHDHPYRPVKFFERHGHLDGSVLDMGGTEEHDFSQFNALTEDFESLDRRWKTIVCGSLAEQTKTERVATLLGARGLLAPDGKVLVALPKTEKAEDWEPLFRRMFEVKALPAKRLLAWQLTPTGVFIEQAAPAPPAALVLPPINLHATIEMPPIVIPKADPAQVTIAPGAVQVDIHQPPPPPPVKKVVTLKKDPMTGQVSGSLETVEDVPAERPEFPDMAALLAEPDGGE